MKITRDNISLVNIKGLAVIGAGLPRTSLTSLRVALGQLLEGPCHHAADVMDGDDDIMDFWIKAFDGKATKKDWVDYFQGKGYRACVDIPALIFWK